MKSTLTLVLAILFSTSLMAQDFQGEASYKSQRKLDIQLDSTQVNSETHQRMMDMLKKQFQKSYTLSFNKEESIYTEDKQLEAPKPAGDEWVMVEMGGSDVLYKNLKEKRYVNQNESFSKLFLIKDNLQTHEWDLSGETKFIGDYKCLKASFTREVEFVESGISVNGDRDLDINEDKTPEMREQIVTAWYTPQIPVNNGPGNYHGLPGLILEINDGTTTIVCNKIVLNPEKKISIEEPKKGKVISQAAYDEVMEKKMKENRARREIRRDDDGGEDIEIRIGG